MKQNRKHIQLDRSKLLGFKLVPSAPAENAGQSAPTRLSAKLGAKLGGKVGGKAGVKPV